MASNTSEKSKEFLQRLAQLKEKSYDVKFDLEGSNYTAIEKIGIGAYGVVCSAIHKKSNDRVAIKKIHKAFEFEKIATRTFREIKILKHFKHDNIISIRDILRPKGSVNEFNDIYIVLDLMESDLHRIIYSKQDLTEEHVRYFLYQLLRGLKYIHSAKVIHRDLKPSNLLVNEDCQLRIGDFGMARGFESSPEQPQNFMTQYVATRWYRAPEIMLSMVEYSSAIDMWSVGCIFAEMLGRKHLFPGKDYIQQIKYIVGVLGSPSQAVMDLCNSDLIKSFVNQLGKKEGISWTTLFPKASRKAINLLSKMLVLHPRERITVEEALKHHYLSKYHDPDDEPICFPAFNFEFENQQINIEQLRGMIYKEIMDYHEPKPFDAFLRPAPKVTSATYTEQVVPEVKVQVGSSTQRSSVDVEMHSAKIENEKKEVPPVAEPVTVYEKTKPEMKENQTVSDNTKEAIKAALKNASLRKNRQESQTDESKNKPVTAAQRQKEREDKRKKKMEKSLERMKKKKSKQGEKKPESLLTNEDKEMLERWAKMQKNVQQIAPKPADGDPKKEKTITIINIQQQVFRVSNSGTLENQSNIETSKTVVTNFRQEPGISTQPNMSALQQSTVQSENKGNVGQMAGDKSSNFQPHQTPSQDSFIKTKDNSVSAASVVNSQSSRNNSLTNSQPNEVEMINKARHLQEENNPANLSNENLDVKSPSFTNRRSPFSHGSPAKDYSNNGSPDSYTSQGSPENFLNTSDQSEKGNTHSLSQNVAIPVSRPEYSSITATNQSFISKEMNRVSSEPSSFTSKQFSEEISQSFPNSNVLSSSFGESFLQAENFTREGNFYPYESQHMHTNKLSRRSSESYQASFPSCQLAGSSGDQFPVYAEQNQNFQQNLNPANQGTPGSVYKPQFYGSTVQQQDFLQNQNNVPFQTYGASNQNMGNFQQTISNTMNNQGQFQQTMSNLPGTQNSGNLTHNPENLSYQENFTNSPGNFTHNGNQGNFTHTSNQGNFMPQSAGQSHQASHSSTNFHQAMSNLTNREQSQLNQITSNIPQTHGNFQDTTPISTHSYGNFQQTGPITTHSNFQQMPQNTTQNLDYYNTPSTSTSNPAPLQINTKTPPDFMTMLTKQFSKSQVEDSCPALAVTPKGTGAGYGLGMDLDSLIMDSQDAELGRPEISPLSSSLLTDWMEVTGDLNIDMDALAQELNLQSPMVFSELSMYPP